MDMDSSVFVRQTTPATVDLSGPLNKRQILYTNWLLLGLDAPTLERKYSIPFNRDMFNLPNKAGAEAVLYFLFTRLNQTMCKEEFRDCWPVRDKKTEALFYRTCNKWLRNIQKEEPDSHLPRINASLFMSPGGEKFYQLLFSFTNYVVQQVVKRECESKARDQLSWPQLSPHNKHLGDVMYRMLQCGVVQRRQKFLDQIETSITVNEEWRETVSDLVKENRRLSKNIRDLEHQLRDENQKAYEKGIARGSPLPSRKSFSSEQDRSSHMVKRAQRVQKVRDKWKKLDAFCNFETRERQVIESILDRTLQKYQIDAADISVKVPDLLLRECETEIIKRHVDNTYEGGKLNILSLIQLWNLSLHLYIERFHQVGVANLEADASHLTAAVQTHHAQITNANAFEKMLGEDFLPLLKKSVSRLREKLEADTSHMMDTPKSGRTRPLGLGLISATPPISFTPKDEDSALKQSLHITPQQDTVMTPEAADNIASTVEKTARSVAKTLFQGSPVYAPKFAMQGKLPVSNGNEGSKIPQPRPTRKDKQLRPPGSRAPQSAEKLQHKQGTEEHPETRMSSVQTDQVTDVLSSIWTTHTTSDDSTLGSIQSASFQSKISNTQGVSNESFGYPRHSDLPTSQQLSTQNTAQKDQTRERSVDDFVDEVVSHMMDDDDSENQPPMDYLQRLHDNELSHSYPRSPFLSFQSNPETNDINISNSNRRSMSLGNIGTKNGTNLSQNCKEGDSSTLQIDCLKNKTTRSLTNVIDETEIFRHPGIPDVEFKDGHGYYSPNKRQYVHRRSLGSEVFRHPEIPEDKSPEITPTTQAAGHSSDNLELHQEENHQNSSVTLDSLESLGEGKDDVPEEPTSYLTGAQQSEEGAASPEQPQITSSKEFSHFTPRQQIITESPDKKLGNLETEIRRMWRESLDGESVPATPKGETTLGSSPHLVRDSISRKVLKGSPQMKTNGHLAFGEDDALATLDDITADILLSPEKDDDGQALGTLGSHQDASFTEDMLSIKTPQLPRIGSKYRVPSASPFLSMDEPDKERGVDSSPAPNPNLSRLQFDMDSHSPLLSQSLPVFRTELGTKSKRDSSITLNYVNTSHMRSVFDDNLDEPGLDEDTPPDLLVSLDDSFTPLLDGLELQGKSPNKSATSEQNQTDADPSLNEMINRFKQLRKNVSEMLHSKTGAASKSEQQQSVDLLQSTSSSDERLMLDLEKKYVTGMNTSWSLLDDETLDMDCLQDS